MLEARVFAGEITGMFGNVDLHAVMPGQREQAIRVLSPFFCSHLLSFALCYCCTPACDTLPLTSERHTSPTWRLFRFSPVSRDLLCSSQSAFALKRTYAAASGLHETASPTAPVTMAAFRRAILPSNIALQCYHVPVPWSQQCYSQRSIQQPVRRAMPSFDRDKPVRCTDGCQLLERLFHPMPGEHSRWHPDL